MPISNGNSSNKPCAAQDAGRPEETLADIEARIQKAEQAHQKALVDIRASGGQLATLVPGQSDSLSVSGVQGFLDARTTLVSYLVLEEQTLAFVMTRDSSTIGIDVLRDQLERDVATCVEIVGDREAGTEDARPWLQGLYRTLIAPLAPAIETPRLFIVPHGRLHDLSFGALQNPATGQYLVEERALMLLPSASVLPYLLSPASNQPG